MQQKFVTSVRIDSSGGGPHEWVTVYIRGQNVGTLCVGRGDAAVLEALLVPEDLWREEPTISEAPAAPSLPSLRCSVCGRASWQEHEPGCPSVAHAPSSLRCSFCGWPISRHQQVHAPDCPSHSFARMCRKAGL